MRKKMGAVRRAELARATFETLQDAGLRNTTVAQVSRHAGLAPGLVHHYFKSKSEMVEAAIRLASTQISHEAVTRLKAARTPRERLDAVIDANLAPSVFTQPVTQAWMAFGVEAAHDERQRRVLNVIERRLQSNLRHCLKALVSLQHVDTIAAVIRMMINGAWQECALSQGPVDADAVRTCIGDTVDARLAAFARPDPDT